VTDRASDPSSAVLVTGCSTGIGRATAVRLARSGHRVYATARRLESIEDLHADGCELLELDVTDEASRAAAVATVEQRDGAVGVLINNAGYSQSGAIETVPLDSVRRQFETNVFGLARMCQLVLPGMRAQRYGKIVNVSSMGGRVVFPGGGYYHASKFAIEAISDALRFEVSGFGVDVIIIEPGLIRTQFAETAATSLGAESKDDDTYAAFEAAVGAATVGAYEPGGMSRLGGDAADVAKTIERAIGARRPRTRYPVTPSARIILFARRLLTDRAWDAIVARTYPRPGSPP
jgi:NAD(P)-dependent dehydrogenase (short-subunit alcohol dehydrogenase family)